MRRSRLLVVLVPLALLGLPASGVSAEEVAAPETPEAATQSCVPEFSDVPCTHVFWGAIGWMAAEGITTGYPDGRFGPASPVLRQALAAFFYRAAGSPPGPFPDPGFPDVPPEHPFFDAIAWMVHEGLATGYPDGTFRPGFPVLRQTIAVTLWRAAGSPEGPFPDPGYPNVPVDHPFHDAIAWLTLVGITTGFPDGTFRPGFPVPRQGAAAFFHRWRLLSTVDVDTTHRCEFLDPGECLLMWPSNHLTTFDPTTGTERRLDLDIESMPRNRDGVPIDPTEFNRSDGFSPGTAIVVRDPGVDLDETGVPPLGDLAQSLEPDSPLVILNADTGERHLHWGELDVNAEEDEDRTLILRPAVNFDEGARYIVALRDLRDAEGERFEPSISFRTYRDQIITGTPEIEARRGAMEEIFDTLESAGIGRHDLYLAWDFTVASQENLSERMLHIRDDAFAQLGPDAPTFAVTGVEEPTFDADPNIARRIDATVEVPLYLTGTGAPGSSFNWGPSGLPERNGTFTALVSCRVPRSASSADPARISLYGHGLLGTRNEVNAGNVRAFANEHNIVFCATDWIGMSTPDVANAAAILANMSLFHTLADRVQQGILNTLFVGRAMRHDEGFATDPAFRDEGGALIDTSELFYDGNSQGAIIGGAATAVSQEWTRAVLGVPGMNYSTLLRRSIDWDPFGDFFVQWYTRHLDQTIILMMIQTQWDRAETNGYAHHLTDDPYPDTPEHQVLLHVAFADHQVAMWTADIMARTAGIHVRQPAMAPGRHPDAVPFYGIPEVPGEGFGGSVMVYWDSGTPPPPITNIAPREGEDPHAKPRAQPSARVQKSEFFRGVFVDVCGTDPCLAP